METLEPPPLNPPLHNGSLSVFVSVTTLAANISFVRQKQGSYHGVLYDIFQICKGLHLGWYVPNMLA